MNHGIQRDSPVLILSPWSEDDYHILELCNTPEMTEYLGGTQPEPKLKGRHYRYLQNWANGTAWFYRVTLATTGDSVGFVGYWPIQWKDNPVYEVGWSIITPYSGKGIATAAAQQLVGLIRKAPKRDAIHAFPSIRHKASNAVCRKAGFTLLGTTEHEYPKGTIMYSNDWKLDLYTMSLFPVSCRHT